MKKSIKFLMLLTLLSSAVVLGSCNSNEPIDTSITNTKWKTELLKETIDGITYERYAVMDFSSSSFIYTEFEARTNIAVITLNGTYTYANGTVTLKWLWCSDSSAPLDIFPTSAIVNGKKMHLGTGVFTKQ